MNNRETVLLKHFKKLKKYPNVLSIRADQNKVINDKETDVEAITFYVSKKVSELYRSGRRRLAKKNVIPTEIDGIPTDVVDFSTKDFKLGRTSKGDLLPHLQRRLMGVRKDE